MTYRERLPVKRDRLDKPAKVERVRLHDTPKAKPKRAKRRTMQMTESRLAALRIDKAGPFFVWDAGSSDSQRGLAVNVHPSGAKTLTAFFNYPNQPSRSMALGRVGELSLEAARKKTAEIRAKAKQGIDPRADDPTRSLTFAELVTVWHEREQTGRKANVSADANKRLVEFHTKAKFWNRPAATVRYSEIDDLLCRLRDKLGKAPTAVRLHAHLSSLFKWAVATRRLAVSPMQGMAAPAKLEGRKLEWFKAPQSDTVLRELWKLGAELGGDSETFIKLLVLTGKRRNAVQGMRWKDIDCETWLWTPPPGSKSKRNNAITLPKLARRVLGPHQKEAPAIRMSDANAASVLSRKSLYIIPVAARNGELSDGKANQVGDDERGCAGGIAA